MGYQIEYEMDKIHVLHRSIPREIMRAVFFVALLVAGTMTVYFSSSFLQELCMKPGVQVAAEQLADDLRSGVGVKDAVQTFCAEIAE